MIKISTAYSCCVLTRRLILPNQHCSRLTAGQLQGGSIVFCQHEWMTSVYFYITWQICNGSYERRNINSHPSFDIVVLVIYAKTCHNWSSLLVINFFATSFCCNACLVFETVYVFVSSSIHWICVHCDLLTNAWFATRECDQSMN